MSPARARKASPRKPAAKPVDEPTPVEAAASAPPEPAAAPTTSSTPKRKARSFYIDEELLERARAAVTYLAAYNPESGVRSLSDVFEPGAWKEVERLEREFNNGEPFRPVARMPTGRPQGQ